MLHHLLGVMGYDVKWYAACNIIDDVACDFILSMAIMEGWMSWNSRLLPVDFGQTAATLWKKTRLSKLSLAACTNTAALDLFRGSVWNPLKHGSQKIWYTSLQKVCFQNHRYTRMRKGKSFVSTTRLGSWEVLQPPPTEVALLVGGWRSRGAKRRPLCRTVLGLCLGQWH